MIQPVIATVVDVVRVVDYWLPPAIPFYSAHAHISFSPIVDHSTDPIVQIVSSMFLVPQSQIFLSRVAQLDAQPTCDLEISSEDFLACFCYLRAPEMFCVILGLERRDSADVRAGL